MHSLCIVVGAKLDDTLAPFANYLKVEKYKSYVELPDVTAMAEHYGISADDLAALAARLPEWHGAEGGSEAGRLFFWSTENPQGKYDWYEVGGRFSGHFRLTHPVPPAWWQRLLGRGPVERVNRAFKRQVDLQAVLSDPPAALLLNSVWHESPITSDEPQLREWKERFATLFEAVPSDASLTAVDIHS